MQYRYMAIHVDMTCIHGDSLLFGTPTHTTVSQLVVGVEVRYEEGTTPPLMGRVVPTPHYPYYSALFPPASGDNTGNGGGSVASGGRGVDDLYIRAGSTLSPKEFPPHLKELMEGEGAKWLLVRVE